MNQKAVSRTCFHDFSWGISWPKIKQCHALHDRHPQLLERTQKIMLNGENMPVQCRLGRPPLAKSWRRVWLVKRLQLGLGSNLCGDRKSTHFSIWRTVSPTTRYKSFLAMNRYGVAIFVPKLHFIFIFCHNFPNVETVFTSFLHRSIVIPAIIVTSLKKIVSSFQ